jgi:hypothetical protein
VGSRAISDRRRYVVHGLGVEIDLDWAALAESADRLLRHFATDYFPPGFNAVFGQIRPYEQSEVLRSLSPTASRLDSASGLLEIYHENERFWLVDERWGLTEINLLKGQWRSWVLPHASMDPVQCVEHAILWPMAQVLRPKGLHLLPAVSIARSGWAALILTPFNIEPELRALIDAGFQVIGQRWTAMREEEGRISLLHLPGLVQPMTSPRLKHRHGAGEIGWTSWKSIPTASGTMPFAMPCCWLKRAGDQSRGWCRSLSPGPACASAGIGRSPNCIPHANRECCRPIWQGNAGAPRCNCPVSPARSSA